MIDLGEIGTATKLRYILRNDLKLLFAEIEGGRIQIWLLFANISLNLRSKPKLEKTFEIYLCYKQENSCQETFRMVL